MLGHIMAPQQVMEATLPAGGTARVAPSASLITRVGTILADKYRIDALLGEGGCGRVYKATHLLLQGTVAIKFLLPAYTTHEVLRERFAREARVLARLCHPGIAAAHDYGEDNGELYLVMEYVAGRQLGLLMTDHQLTGIPIPRIVSITEQILDVLAAAHACGITHRDIKPSNVLLYRDDGGTERLKLLDFGLASIEEQNVKPRLTGSGEVVGTALYMAPEQCSGHPVGHPTDIYSLGVVLYQMLTGRLPFSGKTAYDVMAQHVRAMPPPISKLELPQRVPPRLAQLAMWTLEKSPAARPTAVQFRHELRRAMEDSRNSPRPLSLPIAPLAWAISPASDSLPEYLTWAGVDSGRVSGLDGLVVQHDEPASPRRVALWGHSEAAAAELRVRLKSHRIDALGWPIGDPPAELGSKEVHAIVIPGDAHATERLLRLRKDSVFRETPVLVSSVADVAQIPALIRAGASDMVLTETSLSQLCSQVMRLIRRRR